MVLAIVAAGCTSSSGSSSSFQPAPHPSYAGGLVPDGGGPVLPSMRLVTVSFAGYEHEADVQAFGSWLPTSDWLTTAGAEYGVGAGVDAGHVVLADTAPTTVTLPEVGAFLAARIGDGTLPSSTSIESDYLYVLYYPSSTTVHITAGDAGCSAAGGFHASYSNGGLYFVFAAIPDNCTTIAPGLGLGSLDFVEMDASHEIIEGASDPYTVATDGSAVAGGPSAWHMTDETNPWWSLGGEIGDACTSHCVHDSGFTVQRIWSNRAASQGAEPCLPAVDPEFGVSPTADAPITVAAGQSAQVPLVGWSTTPIASWKGVATSGPYVTSDFEPMVVTQPELFGNGTPGTLTVTVPAGTPSGSHGVVFIEAVPASSPGGVAYGSWGIWPVIVDVP
ncbi:MAG TPA: hypothetical protein VIJ22_20830 [Polyangiaceae bacterium]